MANNDSHSTLPVNSSQTVLREEFAKSIAGQAALMDRFAQQLITIELAIPGIYAAILKLVAGDKATVAIDPWVYGAFACWFLALVLALVSLIPRTWNVDPTILKADTRAKGAALGLEDFYRKSAAYKRWLLIPSTLLFAAGVFCSAMSVF